MQSIATVQWLVRCILGAAMLLFACGLATAWFGNEWQLSSVSSRDDAMSTFNRYSREAVPDVVLIGSSLTYRLSEEYFETARLRNLAIAGGSPVTGLKIIANRRRLPKFILIEMNILSRPIDVAFVEKYSGVGPPEPLFFRPVEVAIAAYEQWLHAPPSRKEASLVLVRLLRQRPSDFDNRVYARRALEQWDAEDPTASVRANVTRIEQLIAALEQRGARILLYELPYSDPLEGSRYAKITHKIVHDKFYDPNRWLRLDFTRSELRWADGAHLDRRSAVIVTQAIDRTLFSLIK